MLRGVQQRSPTGGQRGGRGLSRAVRQVGLLFVGLRPSGDGYFVWTKLSGRGDGSMRGEVALLKCRCSNDGVAVFSNNYWHFFGGASFTANFPP